jgi:hypothetical protein
MKVRIFHIDQETGRAEFEGEIELSALEIDNGIDPEVIADVHRDLINLGTAHYGGFGAPLFRLIRVVS